MSTTSSPRLTSAPALQTVRVLVGSGLGVLPLLQLLTDYDWLVQAWICMAITIVPAALFRLRRSAHVAQLLPGMVLVAGYLVHRYVPEHAWGGVIPSLRTWDDLTAMSTQLGRTVNDSVAPLHSTAPIQLYLSLGLILLALIVDVLAIELHRPALTGVPLLLVFTLAGAVPRQAVSWLWFALAALGFLLILSSSSADDLQTWGRFVKRQDREPRSALTSALSGRRIALIAIVIAVLVPFLLPLGSVNVLANALHNGHPGAGGNGKGGGGVVIDPLAVLRGDLTRSDPVALFTVDVTGAGSTEPFYIRSTVLDTYNGSAWVPGPTPALEAADTTTFSTLPPAPSPAVPVNRFTANFTVQKLAGNAPLFSAPSRVTDIPTKWTWSQQYGLIIGNVGSGQRYSETVEQPAPSIEALQAATSNPSRVGLTSRDARAVLQQDSVAENIPQQVKNLVTQITATAVTPYDKARALSTYFTDPVNGFSYSLETKSGESGSELVDFLTTGKTGFCQQYAAALGVMLRVAGIPARVVLGYTHPAPDAKGHFAVTTDDAHAWVEGYFSGIGWVPFDPTPLTGANAARAVALPWAPHPEVAPQGEAPDVRPGESLSAAAGSDVATADPATTSATAAASAEERSRVWWTSGVVIVLLLAAGATPALLRLRRRRGRLRQARLIGPEPLWQELSDTARDLGLGWSSALTNRQVVSWLTGMLLSDTAVRAMQELGQAVERARYGGVAQSRTVTDNLALVDDLKRVRSALFAAATRRTRVRAVLLPKSLRAMHGWGAGPAPSSGQDRRVGSGQR
jgi:transglutaminase-like putative cysteine protease